MRPFGPPGSTIAAGMFVLSALLFFSGCSEEDRSSEAPRVPELLYEVPASFNCEDLAFRSGRGLVLGRCGGLLVTQSPDIAPEEMPLSGTLFDSPLGIAFGPFGDLYVCDSSGPEAAVIQVSPDGESEILATGFGGGRFDLPNYIALSRDGDIFVSASCDDMIYRISSADGTVTEFLALPGPNGLAFDADEAFLYVTTENPALFCDGPSIPGGLFRVAIEADGAPGELETLVAEFAVAGDGLTFDVEGNLYAVFTGLHGGGLEGLRTSGIFVYSPDGRFEPFVEMRMPEDIITNVAFGVEPFDPRSLYAYGFTGKLYRIPVGVRGLALPGN